ncbi:immunity 7 family protein [Sessilibacter sp. MAH1]
MFEYHAWITIWEASNEEEDDSALLKKNIADINLTIKECGELGRIELFQENGSAYVRMDGDHNHYHPYVLNLFTKIGEIAKGSYGLLYIRDDENAEFNNEFQVWKMAKGVVTKMKDQFLSPCNPTLET